MSSRQEIFEPLRYNDLCVANITIAVKLFRHFLMIFEYLWVVKD
jgi:hypothetical protein